MSAYSPKMAGVGGMPQAKVSTVEAPVHFSAQASVEALPAILRLKAGDGQQKRVAGALSIAPITMSPMSIQLHSTSAPTALLAAAAEERANMRSEGLARAAMAARVAVAADPELLLQIPRLKETLLALDSEMHANASSDVEKRLVMHERILQLQGAELTKVRQAVEQTVRHVGQMMDSHALHGQLHEVAGRKVLQTEAATRDLHAKSELHSRLHHASAAAVFGLEHSVERLREGNALQTKVHEASVGRVLALHEQVQGLGETSALHSQLHHASGAGVLGLHEQVAGIGATSALHSELHHASGAGVLALRKQVAGIGATSALHSELHHASGRGVLDLRAQADSLLQTSALHSELHHASGAGVLDLRAQADSLFETTDLHTQMHRVANESFNALPAIGEPLVTGEVAPGEFAKIQARMDALAAENAQLREAVDKHSSMHAMHAKIAAAQAVANVSAGPCAGGDCHDHTCRCLTCLRSHGHGRAMQKQQTVGEKHGDLLSKLDGELKAANRRHNRK